MYDMTVLKNDKIPTLNGKSYHDAVMHFWSNRIVGKQKSTQFLISQQVTVCCLGLLVSLPKISGDI